MTTMLTHYLRNAIVPMWLAVFGMLALFGSPDTGVTGALLLTVGVVGAAAIVLLWKEPYSAGLLHPAEIRRAQ